MSPGGAGPRISIFTQVCLTEGAKDECNVVEVVGRNHENQEIAVPVANLKLSCQPLVRGGFEGSNGRAAGNWTSLGACRPFHEDPTYFLDRGGVRRTQPAG